MLYGTNLKVYDSAERLAYRLFAKEISQDAKDASKLVEDVKQWAGSSKGLNAARISGELAGKVCAKDTASKKVDRQSLDEYVTLAA